VGFPQKKLCCEWLRRVAAVDGELSPPQEKLCCQWLRVAAGNRNYTATAFLDSFPKIPSAACVLCNCRHFVHSRAARKLSPPQEKLCCEWLCVAAVDEVPLATERAENRISTIVLKRSSAASGSVDGVPSREALL
jgi:hypothetical protein